MPRYNFTFDELNELYHTQKMSAFDIAKKYDCDHKTIRSWMKKLDVPVKMASEYNYQCRNTHRNPTEKELMSPLSIAAHMIYLCEGWHTNSTTVLQFSNQDTQLIDLFIDCVNKIYHYQGNLRISCCYNFGCAKSKNKVNEYKAIYQNHNYKFTENRDKTRKNPILRVSAGGKKMSREFIDNCYWLTRRLVGTPGLEPGNNSF